MSDHENESAQEPTVGTPEGGRPRRTTPPGKSTLTSRLAASPASIARAVVAQLKEEASDTARPAPTDVHAAAAHGTSGSGGSLPHLAEIQRAFGHHDVTGVRAHVGGAAAEASAAMGARAYAAGDSVAFASSPDLHLAAHEAAHVVQQRAGVRLSGGVGAAGDTYEQHADRVADGVVRGDFVQDLLGDLAHRGPAGGPAVQREADAGPPAGVAAPASTSAVSDAGPAQTEQSPRPPPRLAPLDDTGATVHRHIRSLTAIAAAQQQLQELTAVSQARTELVEVRLVGGDPGTVRVRAERVPALTRVAAQRLAELALRRTGPRWAEQASVFGREGSEAMAAMTRRYAGATRLPAATVQADLDRLRAIVGATRAPLPPVAAAHLRLLGESMRATVDAMAAERGPTVGRRPTGDGTAPDATMGTRDDPTLAALRGGIFAAIFYLLEMAISGDRERANRAARAAAAIDTLAGIYGTIGTAAQGREERSGGLPVRGAPIDVPVSEVPSPTYEDPPPSEPSQAECDPRAESCIDGQR